MRYTSHIFNSSKRQMLNTFIFFSANPCLVQNGGCNQICVFTHVSHYCDCKPGYALSKDGITCEGSFDFQYFILS